MSTETKSPSKFALLVIFLTVFIDLVGFAMVLPLLPLYTDHFSADETGFTIAIVMSSYSAMQFLFAPLWGRLSDRIGRRPVLLIGLASSVIFYALFGFATQWKSLTWILVSRIGAGIAGATISTAQAYIADVTTLENRTKGMALIGAAFGLGFTLGPLFAFFTLSGNLETPGAGPGFAASALSFVAFLLAIFVLPESLNQKSAPAKGGWAHLESLSLVFSTKSLSLLLLTSFTSVVAFASFESTISLLLNINRDDNYREIMGVFVFIGFVHLMAQGFIARRLSGKVPEGKLAMVGAVLEIISFVMLAQTGDQSALWFVLTSLALLIVGFAFVTTALQSLISRRADPAKQGSTLGVSQGLSALARIVGPAVGPMLLKSFYPAMPMWFGAIVMGITFVFILIAERSGQDFQTAETETIEAES